MPPTLKDTDLASSETSAIRPASSGSPQTVALEVPVTVNGVRPVEHSDKREPFAEATKTVLVHSAGAVIPCKKRIVPIPRRITIAFSAQNQKKQSQT